MANVTIWLASPLSSYLTGQALIVDGGSPPPPEAAEDRKCEEGP